MGAEPAWATLSLSLPAPAAGWLEEFAAGLGALARAHGVAVVGGDTVRGPLSVSLQLLGFVPAGGALTRAGARTGDGIYVTGQPGAAAAGLRRFGAAPESDPLVEAFLYPRPRVEAGLGLRGLASAAIDVSDGLLTDLCRLLAASGAGGRLDAAALPLPPAALAAFGEDEARRLALTGGDDYELLFTAPAGAGAELARRAAAWGLAVTRIGEVESEPGLRLEGGPPDLPAGWAHFTGGGA
jgi:thiamine-monophosphate kinase